MAEINPDYIELDKAMSSRNLETSPIRLLEKIKEKGKIWNELSEKYGVNNPDPPWRASLESTCDNLANGDSPLNICRPVGEQEAGGAGKKVDAMERRWEEDQLVEERYADVPFPERQLLALAHMLIRRGLLTERELADHMKNVSARLNMEESAYENEKILNTEILSNQHYK